MVLTVSLALAAAVTKPFPERTPAMIEACLHNAIDRNGIIADGDEDKYICVGDSAQALWDFLEAAKIDTWEQDVPEGLWLSRAFPLGACFKQLKRLDGGKPNGLSCTIWIPRPTDRSEKH